MRIVDTENPGAAFEEAIKLRDYMAALQIDEFALAAIWDVPVERVNDVLNGHARLVPRHEQVLSRIKPSDLPSNALIYTVAVMICVTGWAAIFKVVGVA